MIVVIVVTAGVTAVADFIDSTGKMPGQPFHFPSAGFSWNEKITSSTVITRAICRCL